MSASGDRHHICATSSMRMSGRLAVRLVKPLAMLSSRSGSLTALRTGSPALCQLQSGLAEPKLSLTCEWIGLVLSRVVDWSTWVSFCFVLLFCELVVRSPRWRFPSASSSPPSCCGTCSLQFDRSGDGHSVSVVGDGVRAEGDALSTLLEARLESLDLGTSLLGSRG